MEKSPLIYADFMKCDDKNRLVLVCCGTFNDLAEHAITLREGMKLVFYSDDADDNGNQDDLLVEGIVELDLEKERWTAKINWDEIKNISRLTATEKERLKI